MVTERATEGAPTRTYREAPFAGEVEIVEDTSDAEYIRMRVRCVSGNGAIKPGTEWSIMGLRDVPHYWGWSMDGVRRDWPAATPRTENGV